MTYSWRKEWKPYAHQVHRCPVCGQLGDYAPPPTGPLALAVQRDRASVESLRNACIHRLVVNKAV
jgi:hypothetical protein